MSNVRFLQSFVAFFLGVGFIFSTTANNNYGFIRNTAPQEVWAALFIGHGAFLLYSSLFYITYKLKVIEASMAVWLWSFIFLSFTVFDPTPTASTEWMLTMPLIIEILIMAERSRPRAHYEDYE